MKGRFFSLLIKRLMLAFLLIIQAHAFSLPSSALNPHLSQGLSCASHHPFLIIYNENSTLDLNILPQSCTIVVVGNNTHLVVKNADNAHLLAMPSETNSGWLRLQGKYLLNIYYSGIYHINIQGKLQEITLKLPTSNSKVIYENAPDHHRRLRSADQLFVPLEFQTAAVTLLSAESS